MNKHHLAVIGGDSRQVRLARLLCREGYEVSAFGLPCKAAESGMTVCQDLGSALRDAGFIILPLPCSRDGVTVNAAEKIDLEAVIKGAATGAHILAGKVSCEFSNLAAVHGLAVTDYFNCEKLIIKNLVPTVEGALQLMMEKMPTTIHGSRCLITGFGRIGKLLADYLKNMGAHVTVCARKQRDIAYTEILGYKGITYNQLPENLNVDCIINTVPSLVITQKILTAVQADTLILDLASAPGGVDFAYAKQLGLNVEWALSLPGKVAPQTAAEIIKDTVIDIIKDTNERSEAQ